VLLLLLLLLAGHVEGPAVYCCQPSRAETLAGVHTQLQHQEMTEKQI
jgi:hypothetical protein